MDTRGQLGHSWSCPSIRAQSLDPSWPTQKQGVREEKEPARFHRYGLQLHFMTAVPWLLGEASRLDAWGPARKEK